MPAKELAAQLGTMGGSRRPQRRPACPPARVLRPWDRRGSVLLPGLPGPPGAPVTAAGKRAGAALGSCWWSQPGRLRGHCRWSAKCSVMTGGQLVSSRRLIGRSGLKSGSAGSSWRPQLTQISAAPQTMAPVLQDKPRHSTDLAELYSPILWSVSSSSLRKITDTGTIFAIWSWRGPMVFFDLILVSLRRVLSLLVQLTSTVHFTVAMKDLWSSSIYSRY